jgi:hypothetical protein
MVQEKFYGSQEHFLGWKCIYCGEIIDYLILKNRRSLSRTEEEKQEVENGS